MAYNQAMGTWAATYTDTVQGALEQVFSMNFGRKTVSLKTVYIATPPSHLFFAHWDLHSN